MKIYVDFPTVLSSELKSELLMAISHINKKLGSKLKVNLTLIELVTIPNSLCRTNILPALIHDYEKLDASQDAANRLSKLEAAVKNIKAVWDK